jgi:hypothetical protein
MAQKGETLDSLKQRRNSTQEKVEETAKQLNKMNPDRGQIWKTGHCRE